MLYALLIYENEQLLSENPDAQKEHAAEFGDFVKEVADKLRGGAPLRTTVDATTVRVRDGETLTTDGPFAETKEILAGFFIVEVENLDEALAAAAKIPVARTGAIEVRPVAVELMQMVGDHGN